MAYKIKLVIAVALIAAGIWGYYHYADQVFLYRVLGLIAIFIVAAIIALRTEMGMGVWAFGRSAALEVRKSVWPTRRETTQTTLMVMLMVIVIGLILWLFDMFLLWAVQ